MLLMKKLIVAALVAGLGFESAFAGPKLGFVVSMLAVLAPFVPAEFGRHHGEFTAFDLKATGFMKACTSTLEEVK